MRKIISALAAAASLGLLATPAEGRPDSSLDGGQVADSTVSPGQTLVIADQGATPGATVTITLRRSASSSLSMAHVAAATRPSLHQTVGTAGQLAQAVLTLGITTANRDGAFRASVTVPATTLAGLYTLIASSNDRVLGVLLLRVSAATDVLIGLPLISSGIIPGLTVGAGLIVAGGLLLLTVKHRRSSIV
jgi:hypothetical protein